MRYLFGDSMLDTEQYTLCHAEVTVKLRPKVFQLLSYLIAHRDRVVPKHELSAALWADQFVSEATLDSCLAEARQAVGDSGRQQRVIQTRYGYGYRFIAPVEVQSALLASSDEAWSLAPVAGPAVAPAQDLPARQSNLNKRQPCPASRVRGSLRTSPRCGRGWGTQSGDGAGRHARPSHARHVASGC